MVRALFRKQRLFHRLAVPPVMINRVEPIYEEEVVPAIEDGAVSATMGGATATRVLG